MSEKDLAASVADAQEHIHHHFHPHISDLPNEPVSFLAAYAGIILTCILIILFLARHYLLEAWLLPRCYKETYRRLLQDERQRRGFVNHHLAGFIKVVLLLVTAYPYIDVTFGSATLHTPMAPGSRVTMGDFLIVVSELFIAMYVFELLYRSELSPVAVLHHIGAVVIAQSAIALSLQWGKEVDATVEFVLCLTWGMYDFFIRFIFLSHSSFFSLRFNFYFHPKSSSIHSQVSDVV
jgi:hypothetical protein